MQISYHFTLTKIQKLQKKKKTFSIMAGTPGTGWYCLKLASTAGIFSGIKQGGYMYQIAYRYGIFRRYRPVWYGIDSLDMNWVLVHYAIFFISFSPF